ncbi:FAD:protein FMN transferase [Paracoccus albus]|uniref:FAD:protein FMN transferase n=1 Tax=Paracoccus albus TaxID=3017784 RepID=UPI0022F09CDE|nr:FAD:protein FMN transferase [Paracoccus albus]WBU58949.1 FAD:protein FMN transferase [Paracoccus albus]
MKRRRFLSIAAGLAVAPAFPSLAAPSVRQWHGTALGAAATIAMEHPDADRLIDVALGEINRLERVFSLYRDDSALSRLNAEGRLSAPPFELLECLSLCDRVHAASGGLFDPTVQPLWSAYAKGWAQDGGPDDADIRRASAQTGWQDVQFDPAEVRLLRPGMALTLNGVAQGVIADRVAELLRHEGLTDVLVDAGEVVAAGSTPDGKDWPVTLQGGQRITLRDRAVATSARRGTVFDPQGRVGHILHPAHGAGPDDPDTVVSISARSAGMADALTTAACLMQDKRSVTRMLAAFPDTRLLSFMT